MNNKIAPHTNPRSESESESEIVNLIRRLDNALNAMRRKTLKRNKKSRCIRGRLS